MDWTNERYVRVYIRDTTTWLRLRWEGQVLFMLMIRKCDRSGILDDIEDPVEDLSLITGLPAEHVKAGYNRLVKRGVIELREGTILIPNFIEAQEACKSDAQRQRESRDKRRMLAKSKSVTKRDEMSQSVTSGHNQSQPVTLYCAVPSCADPVLNSAVPNKKTKAKKGYSQDFENFWKAYPKKKAKGKAAEAWTKQQKNGNWPGVESVMSSLAKLVTSYDWTKEGGQYVPYPASWLNAGGWDDEPTGAPAPPSQPKSKFRQDMDLLDSIINSEDEQPPVKVTGKVEVVG